MFYNLKRILATMLAVTMTIAGYFNFAGVIVKFEKVMAEYYVSADGNDSGNGSKETPFATIERARDEARKYNDNMTGDILIHIDVLLRL